MRPLIFPVHGAPSTPPAQIEDGSSLSLGNPTREDVAEQHGAIRECWHLRDAHIKSQPWKPFFNSRKVAHNAYLKSERAEQKVTRLNP